MKEFLTALCFLAFGTVLSAARPVGEEDARNLHYNNPAAAQPITRQQPQRFVSQQMAKPPIKPKRFSRKMRAYQMQPTEKNLPSESPAMRPGRNYDNPAANRFGDGSPRNTYIWGSGRR